MSCLHVAFRDARCDAILPSQHDCHDHISINARLDINSIHKCRSLYEHKCRYVSSKIVVSLQNKFLEGAQEQGLPRSSGSMPLHLLTHSSTEQYLLATNPFQFDSHLYSQVPSDTPPIEFDRAKLTSQVAEVVANKRFIVNTMASMHKDFCYKQPIVLQGLDQGSAVALTKLPAAFAVPLSLEQLNSLRTHCSHIQLEELQQICNALTTLSQMICQQNSVQEAQQLLPCSLIADAVKTLIGGITDATAAGHHTPGALQHRPFSSFFSRHGMQGLVLSHLQPVRDCLIEQHKQQGYQFADISPLLKAPMSAEDAARLQRQLAHGCKQDVHNAQALADLVAALREAELSVLPGQANLGATIRSVCEAWAYEPDEFPVSLLHEQLVCSQYVAVMSIMLQVKCAASFCLPAQDVICIAHCMPDKLCWQSSMPSTYV